MSFNKVNQTTGELTRIAGNGDIPIDSTPTQGSTNAVQSGGTFSAIKAVSDNVGALSDDVDELGSQMQTLTPTILTQTLTAGSTSLTFTNANIRNNSRISFQSSPFTKGLIDNAVQSGTTVTLTCKAQLSNVSVKLIIYNN